MTYYNMLKVIFFFVVLGMSNSDDPNQISTDLFRSSGSKSLNDANDNKDAATLEQPDDDQYYNALLDPSTWLAASVSIFLISLLGILGVLIVPFMQKVYYQYLIQFLIAMAVGTLIGDALIHLLPHAFEVDDDDHAEEHDHDNGFHTRAVWMGCVATVSIIGYFLLEKSINLVEVLKTCKQQNNKENKRTVKVVRGRHVVVEKTAEVNRCMKKYSKHCAAEGDPESTKANEGREDDKGCSNQCDLEPVVENKQDSVIITQHEVEHHGHSHVHSHLKSPPRHISSAAWMVIVGDGIHNLADGLAVGASFASGFLYGVSTSIAVLCHELPHEIGDFAMLLKAGMSVKQAVFYNVISSILGFIGMILGILLGTITNVTPWIFSITAGIFLYVGLVDMLPELSSGHAHPTTKDKHGQKVYMVEVVLQLLGMCLGVAIMLVIAIYEPDMLAMFGHDGDKDLDH